MLGIGIDIGGTNLRVARVNAIGEIEAARSIKTASDASVVSRSILELARELENSSVQGFGVGAPGRVDFVNQRVLSGGYTDLSATDLVAMVESEFHRPCVVDTDANLALIAEHQYGSAKNTRNAVLLTIGTGIGGAAIVDGKLLRGKQAAGQFGHLTVDIAGMPCTCGRRGCVETLSSGSALGRLLTESEYPPGTRGEDILRRAEDGEQKAKDVLQKWARPLRSAIDSIVASLDPERLILGGGLGELAFRSLDLLPAERSWYQAKVLPAQLGDRAGVIGGAWIGANPDRGVRQ